MDDKKELNITITKNEAIVFFEFLKRFNSTENDELFVDQSEKRILWDVESMLEKELVEPFQSDYLDLVKKARYEVRDSEV